jgi:dipeptidyl aminopeptidase/acylaminoacyl peptidase
MARTIPLAAGLPAVFLVVLLVLVMPALSQEPYRQPPKEILDVLHARTTPLASISPSRDYMLLIDTMRYPPISVISEPMLRLAGLRINPNTNGARLVSYETGFSIKRISDGAEHKVALPTDAKLSQPEWSPDGKRFAFTNTASNAVELWVGSADSGEAHRVKGVIVNGAYGRAIHWMPDSRTLLVQTVPASRGNPPAEPSVPKGPHVQETHGKGAPVATYEDLLANPHDEDLFDYYATSQLSLVDVENGKVKPIGEKGVFLTDTPSPDGNFILIARLHRPYSYLHPHFDFPKEVEVWDGYGKSAYKLASLPLADRVPIEGVPTGPRDYQWRSDQPATLAWVEALDGGDTRKPAEYRDKLALLKAPFTGQPQELIRTPQRFAGVLWGEKDGLALVSDYERKRRWSRTLIVNADNSSEPPRELWGRNQQDRYKDPGSPILRGDTGGFGGGGGGGMREGGGRRPILQSGDYIYLRGEGASPQGDRPFLDRLNLKTLKTERLFQCGDSSFESVIALLDDEGSKFITRRESPTEQPNYFIRAYRVQYVAGTRSSMGRSLASDAGAYAALNPQSDRALTEFPDPAPQLKGITKQLVTYKRQDGVPLSFTLYLPPGYKQGERLPTVVWAYPLEYNDAATAGQVAGSTNRFTTISGPSELFFLLEGYAVLDNAAMPIVGGDPDTVNNTYVEQLTMDAKAAIDKAAEMGVTDPDRVGVGGHSYGAFMTANLLAHTRLFRAGIARSGAYNRTLTPFGFQSERRTFWEATDLYMKMSPFSYANAIKDPILLMHGEADNNSGTFPIQSERMYQALRGNGATVRLVTLPDEAHGYSARESVEHTLYEMISWFDRYVKNAGPRGAIEEKAAN